MIFCKPDKSMASANPEAAVEALYPSTPRYPTAITKQTKIWSRAPGLSGTHWKQSSGVPARVLDV
ncbi:unnamed protein product [Cercospora beticola]|nr:unnamed protein product [Cercospora beticola]